MVGVAGVATVICALGERWAQRFEMQDWLLEAHSPTCFR